MSHDIDMPGEGLVIRGAFQRPDGSPITGAAVYYLFRGDPPGNCGTSFDLENAPARTDDSGKFCLTNSQSKLFLSPRAPTDAWQSGWFVVIAIKDARTIGYIVAPGEVLVSKPIVLTELPTADLQGRVVDEEGRPVASATVVVERYLFYIGSGEPWSDIPINFSLSRSRKIENELVASTSNDGWFNIPRVPAMPGKLHLAVTHSDFARLETTCHPYHIGLRPILQRAAAVCIQVMLPDRTSAMGYQFALEGVPDGFQNWTHRYGETNDEGQLEIGSLPSGSYTVRYLGGPSKEWAIPALDVPDLHGGEQRQITAAAVRGSILCGRVLDAQSKRPIPRAEVRFHNELYPDTASTIQAENTDADGVFTFDYAIAPGTFEISVSSYHLDEMLSRALQATVGPDPRTELTLYLDPVRDRFDLEDDEDAENEDD